MDWEAIKPQLGKKLDPAHIQKPNGRYGPKGDYLEGWFVIQTANDIFGYGGWSYTIDLKRDDLRELEKIDQRTKEVKTQWQAAYTCICTLTVGDVVRQDVGFGSGFAAQIGDAIEGATKEAATDALKRAFRTFGNQFGLALYDKTRENVGIDFNAEAAASRIKGMVEKADSADRLTEIWRTEKTALEEIKAANESMFNQLVAKFKEMKETFNKETEE